MHNCILQMTDNQNTMHIMWNTHILSPAGFTNWCLNIQDEYTKKYMYLEISIEIENLFLIVALQRPEQSVSTVAI